MTDITNRRWAFRCESSKNCRGGRECLCSRELLDVHHIWASLRAKNSLHRRQRITEHQRGSANSLNLKFFVVPPSSPARPSTTHESGVQTMMFPLCVFTGPGGPLGTNLCSTMCAAWRDLKTSCMLRCPSYLGQPLCKELMASSCGYETNANSKTTLGMAGCGKTKHSRLQSHHMGPPHPRNNNS